MVKSRPLLRAIPAKSATDALNSHARVQRQFGTTQDIRREYSVQSNRAQLTPLYSFPFLLRMTRTNSMLAQCIQAMVTNIAGYGYHLEYIGPPDLEESPEALAEKARIEGMLDLPNGETSMVEIRRRIRADMETFGDGWLEVVRNKLQLPSAMYHVGGQTMRITVPDDEGTPVTVWRKQGDELIPVITERKFRRYVQTVGGRNTYFKEFGDPRMIDSETGDETNDASRAATELIRFSLYGPGETYGVPRWMHQLPAIMGSNEADLTNLQYFTDNAIPAMIVSMAGGQISEATVDAIQEAFQDSVGRDAAYKVIFLPVEPSDAVVSKSVDAAATPIPRVDIKSLHGERMQDALFLEYDARTAQKVRSAFRIHPMFVGLSDDLTHATASASVEITDAQVFAPERDADDLIINTRLLVDVEGRPPQYWWHRSNGPTVVDPDAVIAALSALEAVGAMTPNSAREVGSGMLGMELPRIQEPWGDVPFTLTVLEAGQPVMAPPEEEPEEPDEPDESNPADDMDEDQGGEVDDSEARADAREVTREVTRAATRSAPVGEEVPSANAADLKAVASAVRRASTSRVGRRAFAVAAQKE